MFFEGVKYWSSTTKTLVEYLSNYGDLDILSAWDLLNRTANDIARHFDIMAMALMIMVAIVIFIGIAILINQRKIKKQLRQLLEQKETNEADKPQE